MMNLEQLIKLIGILENIDGRLTELENKANFYCAYTNGDKKEISDLKRCLTQIKGVTV